MTLSDLQMSLSSPEPPTGLTVPLLGLWYAAKGDWDKAHKTVQDDTTPESAWVHAHLHKQEGDISNANYWYAKSPRNTSRLTLQEEWREIAGRLLRAQR
ncbi:MAG TPA: hypothetical protein VGA55_08130 [Bacteroidota bacterium]